MRFPAAIAAMRAGGTINAAVLHFLDFKDAALFAWNGFGVKRGEYKNAKGHEDWPHVDSFAAARHSRACCSHSGQSCKPLVCERRHTRRNCSRRLGVARKVRERELALQFGGDAPFAFAVRDGLEERTQVSTQ